MADRLATTLNKQPKVGGHYPISPVVVGLLLGPLAEQQLRRALSISQGDPTVLVHSWIAVVLLLLAAAAVELPLDELDRPPGLGGRDAGEGFVGRRGLLLASQAFEQRDDAPPEVEVLSFVRHRAPGGVQRTLEITELVAHLAQDLPLDGTGRAPLEHRGEELALATEVIPDQCHIDPCAPGDVAQRDAVEATLREQLLSGIENALLAVAHRPLPGGQATAPQ